MDVTERLLALDRRTKVGLSIHERWKLLEEVIFLHVRQARWLYRTWQCLCWYIYVCTCFVIFFTSNIYIYIFFLSLEIDTGKRTRCLLLLYPFNPLEFFFLYLYFFYIFVFSSLYFYATVLVFRCVRLVEWRAFFVRHSNKVFSLYSARRLGRSYAVPAFRCTVLCAFPRPECDRSPREDTKRFCTRWRDCEDFFFFLSAVIFFIISLLFLLLGRIEYNCAFDSTIGCTTRRLDRNDHRALPDLCGMMMETQNYWDESSAHSMQVKYERWANLNFIFGIWTAFSLFNGNGFGRLDLMFVLIVQPK